MNGFGTPGSGGWSRGMVRVERDGNVALLTLDRPGKLNAMERAFWTDLPAGLEWIRAQGDIGAIVMTGAGERAFSVGGDIESFGSLATDAERRAFQIEAMQAFEAVANFPLPIIAAVRGFALGGGCEMTMACDFVLAGRSAVFGLPEAKHGLVPGYGVLRAPSIIGLQMTKMMVFAGERLNAEQALFYGLVQKLFDDEQLISEALRMARAVAEVPPSVIAAGKALMDPSRDQAAIDRSIAAISELHATPEARAAVAGFVAAARRER